MIWKEKFYSEEKELMMVSGYTAITTKLIKEVKTMTNYESIKQMSVGEMALLLMKVNCAYDIPCMLGISNCKYPHIDNNCSICFKEWLESEVEDNDY